MSKRKTVNAKGSEKTKKPKQGSLVSFFSQPKDELLECKLEEFEQPLEELEEEEKKLYTTSMYTDEFNILLNTVLEEESFLFSEEEKDIFQTFHALEGLILTCQKIDYAN